MPINPSNMRVVDVARLLNSTAQGFVLAMASLAMQSGYLFGVAAATVLSCVLTWASMRVFANISLRLKAIQDVMCQKNMVTETNGEQMAIENSKVEEVKPQIKKF